MKKIKILVMSMLLIGSILLLSSNVKAEGILVKKSVTAGKGIITFVISGLNVDTTKTYYYILKTEQGEFITGEEKLHLVTVLDESSVSIKLHPTNNEVYTYLTTKDKAKVTIKKEEDNSIILDSQLVDLSLPVTQAMEFKTVDSSILIAAPYKNYNQINYQFVKITDQILINDYLQLRSEGKDISELNDKLTKEVPQSGWLSGNQPSLPTEEGLYYIWGQAVSEGKKTISGYILYDNLPKTDNPEENNTTNNTTNDNTSDNNVTNANDANVANNTITNENKVENVINNNKDNTVNNNKIPNAGTDFVVCGVIALIFVIGIMGITKYKKYKEIK